LDSTSTPFPFTENVAIVSPPPPTYSSNFLLSRLGPIGDYAYSFGLRVKRLWIHSDYYPKSLWSRTVENQPEAASISKLTQPELLVLAEREGSKKGIDGEFTDAKLLYGQPRGFEVNQIKHRPFFVFHGEADPYNPTTAATFTCSEIEGSKCTIYPKLGHLAIADKWEEILQALTTTKK